MNVESKEDKKRRIDEWWANILLRHLKKQQGCDYAIGKQHTPDGWADVDVFARSKTDKYPPLYIQLCSDINPKDPGFEKILKKSKMFKNFGQTIEAVKGKVEKYKKQDKDFSQITLVIQSHYLIDHDAIYRVPKLRDECNQYKFKAIYLLSPKGQFADSTGTERVFQLL